MTAYGEAVARWTAPVDKVLSPDRPAGVWVVYFWDNGYHANAVFDDLEAAVRASDSYHEIAYWPFGVGLDVAVKQWKAGQ